jgi:hypothetical protein
LKDTSYSDFTEHTFGFRIERVSDEAISSIEEKIHSLEKKIGLSREAIFKKHNLKSSEYEAAFKRAVLAVKHTLPAYITDFPDKGFDFEIVEGKAWSAFNSHTAVFRSKLSLNKDITFTDLDLYRLAFHEAYGGHHSELSQKDILLTTQERGEHGLVITFSPQSFISEAIAEGVFVLLGGLDEENDEQMLAWQYDRLTFALGNIATFWFFDDGVSKEDIQSRLSTYDISSESVRNIFNFSTDSLFGRYAPIYYSAFNFIQNLYAKTNQKEKLIKELFTLPCTPGILAEEFGMV